MTKTIDQILEGTIYEGADMNQLFLEAHDGRDVCLYAPGYFKAKEDLIKNAALSLLVPQLVEALEATKGWVEAEVDRETIRTALTRAAEILETVEGMG